MVEVDLSGRLRLSVRGACCILGRDDRSWSGSASSRMVTRGVHAYSPLLPTCECGSGSGEELVHKVVLLVRGLGLILANPLKEVRYAGILRAA